MVLRIALGMTTMTMTEFDIEILISLNTPNSIHINDLGLGLGLVLQTLTTVHHVAHLFLSKNPKPSSTSQPKTTGTTDHYPKNTIHSTDPLLVSIIASQS